MATADRLVDKMLKMRVFADDNGKTNLSLTRLGADCSSCRSLRYMPM